MNTSAAQHNEELNNSSKLGKVKNFQRVSPSQADSKLINALNGLLSNEFMLFTMTLNYHWNVTGPRFHSIHQFLDTHYHELLEVIDNTAERVRQVGGYPIGTLEEITSSSSLTEKPKTYPEPTQMIADLMAAHESLQIQIKSILKGIDSSQNFEPTNHDFLTSLLQKHEKMSWMLKSHLG